MTEGLRRWPPRAIVASLLLVPAGLVLPRLAVAPPLLAALVCLAATVPLAAVLGYAGARLAAAIPAGRLRAAWRALSAGAALLVVGLVLAAAGLAEVATAAWVGTLVGAWALLPGVSLLAAGPAKRDGPKTKGGVRALPLVAGALAIAPTLLHPGGKPPGELSAASCLVLLVAGAAAWWSSSPGGSGATNGPGGRDGRVEGRPRFWMATLLFGAAAGLLALLARALAPIAEPAFAELGMGPVAAGMLLVAPVTGVAQSMAERWTLASGRRVPAEGTPAPDSPWPVLVTLPMLVVGSALLGRQGFAGLFFGRVEALALSAAVLVAALAPAMDRQPRAALGLALVGLSLLLLSAPLLLGY